MSGIMLAPGDRHRRRDPGGAFTNRVEQSQIFRTACQTRLSGLRGDSQADHHNLLVFHGGGGSGKTQLSRQLRRWILGKKHEIWGEFHWSAANPLVACHLQLDNSRGVVDPVTVLLMLRRALGKVRRRWPAVDLALTAYLNSVQPGGVVDLTVKAGIDEPIHDVLTTLATEIGMDAVLTSVAGHAIRDQLRKLRNQLAKVHSLRDYPDLAALLGDCSDQVDAGNPDPDVAADIVSLMLDSLSHMDVNSRPLVVVFVDTFEALQTSGRRCGERFLNDVVYRLPVMLFVVTGRNQLDWHQERSSLYHWGQHIWPGLSISDGPNKGQYELGWLELEDAHRMLQLRSSQEGWDFAEGALEAVVADSKGFPLHLDAVCQRARNLARYSSDPIQKENLSGSLRDVVLRLLADLTETQARAFHGACLMPRFDAKLAAAAARVSEADVLSCAELALIDRSDDPDRPYMVHQHIRELIRDAGPTVPGGMSDADWKVAALRLLTELKNRYDAVDSTDMITPTIIVAEALNLAHEYRVWEPWIAKGVNESLCHEMIARYLPTRVVDVSSETCAMIQLLQARTIDRVESIPLLRSVWETGTDAAKGAGLFLAYHLRDLGYFEESDAQLRAYRERYPEGYALAGRQLIINLLVRRRFVDAFSAMPDLPVAIRPHSEWQLKAFIGLLQPNDIDWREGFIRDHPVGSRRYRHELGNVLLWHRVRHGLVARGDCVRALRDAEDIGHNTSIGLCLSSLGGTSLGKAATVESLRQEMRALAARRGAVHHRESELLALHALYQESDELAREAHLIAANFPFRDGYWLLTEAVLNHLGHPLPDVETQWPESPEVVYRRFVVLAEAMVTRSATELIH